MEIGSLTDYLNNAGAAYHRNITARPLKKGMEHNPACLLINKLFKGPSDENRRLTEVLSERFYTGEETLPLQKTVKLVKDGFEISVTRGITFKEKSTERVGYITVSIIKSNAEKFSPDFVAPLKDLFIEVAINGLYATNCDFKFLGGENNSYSASASCFSNSAFSRDLVEPNKKIELTLCESGKP